MIFTLLKRFIICEGAPKLNKNKQYLQKNNPPEDNWYDWKCNFSINWTLWCSCLACSVHHLRYAYFVTLWYCCSFCRFSWRCTKPRWQSQNERNKDKIWRTGVAHRVGGCDTSRPFSNFTIPTCGTTNKLPPLKARFLLKNHLFQMSPFIYER